MRSRSRAARTLPTDQLTQRSDAETGVQRLLDVEDSGAVGVDREQHLEVAPTQLLRQRGDNRAVGEDFRELTYAVQAGAVEATPVTPRQLSRQRGDNLLGATWYRYVFVGPNLSGLAWPKDGGTGDGYILPGPYDATFYGDAKLTYSF